MEDCFGTSTACVAYVQCCQCMPLECMYSLYVLALHIKRKFKPSILFSHLTNEFSPVRPTVFFSDAYLSNDVFLIMYLRDPAFPANHAYPTRLTHSASSDYDRFSATEGQLKRNTIGFPRESLEQPITNSDFNKKRKKKKRKEKKGGQPIHRSIRGDFYTSQS
jgi:hypothetical protein